MVKKFLSLVLFGFFSLSALSNVYADGETTVYLKKNINSAITKKNYSEILSYTDSVKALKKDELNKDFELFLENIASEHVLNIVGQAIVQGNYKTAFKWFKWTNLKNRPEKKKTAETIEQVLSPLVKDKLNDLNDEDLLILLKILPEGSSLDKAIKAVLYSNRNTNKEKQKIDTAVQTFGWTTGLSQLKEKVMLTMPKINNGWFKTAYSNFKNYVFAPVKKYVRASDIVVGASIVAAAYGIKYFSK